MHGSTIIALQSAATCETVTRCQGEGNLCPFHPPHEYLRGYRHFNSILQLLSHVYLSILLFSHFGYYFKKRLFAIAIANTPAKGTKDSTCGPNPYGSRSQSQEEESRVSQWSIATVGFEHLSFNFTEVWYSKV